MVTTVLMRLVWASGLPWHSGPRELAAGVVRLVGVVVNFQEFDEVVQSVGSMVPRRLQDDLVAVGDGDLQVRVTGCSFGESCCWSGVQAHSGSDSSDALDQGSSSFCYLLAATGAAR